MMENGTLLPVFNLFDNHFPYPYLIFWESYYLSAFAEDHGRKPVDECG
jgi:hypothetical protein